MTGAKASFDLSTPFLICFPPVTSVLSLLRSIVLSEEARKAVRVFMASSVRCSERQNLSVQLKLEHRVENG